MTGEYDIVVVGGGPAGLSSALELGNKKGLKVLLIEKNRIGVSTKTTSIWKNQLRKFDLQKCAYNNTETFSVASSVDSMRSTHRGDMSMVDLSKALNSLKKRIKNCEIRENTELKNFSYVDGGLSLDTNKGEIKTKLLIDASGYKGVSTKKFGLQKNMFFYQCYAMECKVPDYDTDSVLLWDLFDKTKKTSFWIDVFSKRDIVVGVMMIRKRKCSYEKLEKELRRYIKKKKIVCNPIGKRWGILPMYNFEKAYFERVLLVGDAASQVIPGSGYGFMSALKNGKIAGKVAYKAIKKGNCSEVFLKLYSKLWKSGKIRKYDLNALLLFLETKMTPAETAANVKIMNHLCDKDAKDILTDVHDIKLMAKELFWAFKEIPILKIFKRFTLRDYPVFFGLVLKIVKDMVWF